MSIEVKVVIVLKGDKGSIGVQSPDSDPILITFEGGMETALQMVPDLMEAAHQQWAERRRYPEAEKPPPTPRPTTQASSPQRTTRAAQPAGQQRLF